MFLPIGDSPNPERFTPWVNYALIAANVVVFFMTYVPLANAPVTSLDAVPSEALEWLRSLLASNPGYRPSQYDVFTYVHGYKPGAPEASDLFSAMFLHAGWAHLLGNMLFLWIYGDNVEHRLGRFRYLLVYILTGIAATLTFAVMAAGSTVPMIGASGAISGVLGMYFIMFPHNVVKVFAFFFPFIFGVYPFNARFVLGFYIIAQNIFPALLEGRSGGGVAYGAHIGGFVAGLGVALITERFAGAMPRASFGAFGARRPPARDVPRAQPRVVDFGDGEAAFRRAVEVGDRREAFRRLNDLSVLKVAESMPNETVRVAQWLADEDRLIQASELVRKVIRFHRPPAVDQAEVYFTLGLVRLKQGQPTSAYQHFMDALDFGPSDQTRRRIHDALGQINVYRRPS